MIHDQLIISFGFFLGCLDNFINRYIYFHQENCFPCPAGGCPNMGHYADKFKDRYKDSSFVKLYLNTAEAKDFAREF